MKKAALYVEGRIVVADSHLEAYQRLTYEERESDFVSGFFDSNTQEFDADQSKDHFYDKEILLIRHAETSPINKYDPPLSERGVKQAECLAGILLKLNISSFVGFTSPLLRCLQTCNIIKKIGIDFTVMPSIMETPDFLEENEDYVLWSKSHEFPDFNWPEERYWILKNENPVSFFMRVKNALQKLPQKSIVISHYGVIINMIRNALCEEKSEILVQEGLPTASITYINKQEFQKVCPDENHHEVRPYPQI